MRGRVPTEAGVCFFRSEQRVLRCEQWKGGYEHHRAEQSASPRLRWLRHHANGHDVAIAFSSNSQNREGDPEREGAHSVRLVRRLVERVSRLRAIQRAGAEAAATHSARSHAEGNSPVASA